MWQNRHNDIVNTRGDITWRMLNMKEKLTQSYMCQWQRGNKGYSLQHGGHYVKPSMGYIMVTTCMGNWHSCTCGSNTMIHGMVNRRTDTAWILLRGCKGNWNKGICDSNKWHNNMVTTGMNNVFNMNGELPQRWNIPWWLGGGGSFSQPWAAVWKDGHVEAAATPYNCHPRADHH